MELDEEAPTPVFHVCHISRTLHTEREQSRKGQKGCRGSSSCAAKPTEAAWVHFPLLILVLTDRQSVWHGDCSSGWRWRKLQSQPEGSTPCAVSALQLSHHMCLRVPKSSMHEKNMRLANIYMLCNYQIGQSVSAYVLHLFLKIKIMISTWSQNLSKNLMEHKENKELRL